MIITFCGHADCLSSPTLADEILSAIKKIARDEAVSFYLGGYGRFDNIALECCIEYKKTHPVSNLFFITPYLTESYLKSRPCFFEYFDEILYPGLEKTPPRYAILKRNEWMVENADFVIAYVIHGWGGAAKTFRHVLAMEKPYINLGGKDE